MSAGMIKYIKISLVIGLIYCWNLPAWADDLKQEYQDMDLNQDDRVTWKEYRQYVSTPVAAEFDKTDLDRDGYIELFEWVSYQNKKFPDLSATRYDYTERNGQQYRYRNGQWYKNNAGIWYAFKDNAWLVHAHIRRHPRYSTCDVNRSWSGDCARNDWRYGYGFHYTRGSRGGYGFGFGIGRRRHW